MVTKSTRYPFVPLSIYLPVVGIFLVWGSSGNPSMRMLEKALCLTSGLLFWTLLEYVMHRFVFHEPGIMVLLGGGPPHSRHHETPTEPDFIITPLSFSLPVAALVWILLRIGLGTWERAAIAMVGVILGYLAYEAIHFRIHTSSGGGATMRWLRRHHYRHHFTDPEVCFGVTTPIWDSVLRTLPRRACPANEAAIRQ